MILIHKKWHGILVRHTCHRIKWSFTISWICSLGHTSLLSTWQLNSCGFWTLTSSQRFKVFAWSRASMKEPKKRISHGGRNRSSNRFDFVWDICFAPVTRRVISSSCRSVLIIQYVLYHTYIYIYLIYIMHYRYSNWYMLHDNTYGFPPQNLWIYQTHYSTTVAMNTLDLRVPGSHALEVSEPSQVAQDSRSRSPVVCHPRTSNWSPSPRFHRPTSGTAERSPRSRLNGRHKLNIQHVVRVHPQRDIIPSIYICSFVVIHSNLKKKICVYIYIYIYSRRWLVTIALFNLKDNSRTNLQTKRNLPVTSMNLSTSSRSIVAISRV